MFLFAIVFIVFIVLLSYNYLDPRTIYLIYKYPKVKCFTFVPILGHIGFLKYTNSSVEDIEDVLDMAGVNHGRLFFCAGVKFLPLCKAHHLKEILTNPATQGKPSFYNFMLPVTQSMLCINDKPWKQRRKQMSPLMHKEVIDSFVEDISNRADTLADALAKKTGETFDAEKDISKCTSHVFSSVVLGVDQILNEYIANMTSMTSLAMKRILHLFSHLDFIYNWTREGKLMKILSRNVFQIIENVITERKKVLDIPEVDIRHRHVIDHLMNLKFSDDIVKQETILFTTAGHDTSAFAISSTLAMLAMHPEVQTKAYHEIIDVLGEDRGVEPGDLRKLTYLTKVIKETLRLLPPIPTVARINPEEVILEGNIIPKNTYLILSIRHVQRDPEYWPDPLKFDPERFDPEVAATRPDFCYLPFLGGARNCFGGPFAMANVTTTLAVLLRKFEWFTPYKSLDDIKLQLNITTKYASDLLLRVEHRENYCNN